MDFCSAITTPRPLHFLQVFSPNPPFPWHFSQASFNSKSRDFLHPKTASTNVKFIFTKRSLPFDALFALPLFALPPKLKPNDEPNKSSKILDRSMSSALKPPNPPPAPPSKAAWPN